jgi:ribulose-5-phosphate 4-epimerase/fuculose-1-phosphate aldolase
VWDIADHVGDQTNLLVTHMPQGCDVGRGLGSHRVALMRSHGVAAAAPSLIEVVSMSVYVPHNARALMAAMRLGGEVKSLSQGEIAARAAGADQPHTCDGAEERQCTVIPPTAAGVVRRGTREG